MRSVVPGLAVLLAIISIGVDAQETKPNAEAATLFNEAVTAYRKDRCQESADLFQRAYQLEPSKETLIQAARAYVCASDQLLQAAAVSKPDDADLVCISKRELERLVRALGVATLAVPKVRTGDFVLDEDNPF
jgi:hypothetical protein